MADESRTSSLQTWFDAFNPGIESSREPQLRMDLTEREPREAHSSSINPTKLCLRRAHKWQVSHSYPSPKNARVKCFTHGVLHPAFEQNLEKCKRFSL